MISSNFFLLNPISFSVVVHTLNEMRRQALGTVHLAEVVEDKMSHMVLSIYGSKMVVTDVIACAAVCQFLHSWN